MECCGLPAAAASGENCRSIKDLLLCFLYSPGQENGINEPIVGRTKLTKMMFLFEKEIYNNFFKDGVDITLPEFKAYYFGPFSRQLFEDLSFFKSIGIIQTRETVIPISPADKVESEEVFDYDSSEDWNEACFDEPEKYELEYQLSKSGTRYVEDNVWTVLTPKQQEKLQAFKAQINKISLDALLRYVYNRYPEETTKSKIASKYLNESGE